MNTRREKMKRILIVILAAAMAISVAACGNKPDVSSSEVSTATSSASSNEKVDETSKADSSSSSDVTTPAATSEIQVSNLPVKEFPDFIKGYVDLSHYDVTQENRWYTKKSEYGEPYQFAENKDARLFTSPIRIEGNTEIDVGMSYADFTAQGWKSVDQSSLDVKIEPHKKMDEGMEYEYNGKKIKVYWGNTTASEVKLSEATVDSFDVRQFDPADDFRIPITSATSFLLNDKVNNHSDLKEIIETFGEPQTIHYLFGWDSSTIVIAYDGYYCSAPEFYLSPDGKILYELQVS